MSIPKFRFGCLQSDKGEPGSNRIDDQFERELANNLHKLWNRMSSGSYSRRRGSEGTSRSEEAETGYWESAVSDRIAQAVVKGHLEAELEKYFHPDSYGYRPSKSALTAVVGARERG